MRAFAVAASATILFARVLAGDTGPRITESQFLEPLESGHPVVVALGQSLAEAEAAARTARTMSNPELGASREAPGELEQLDVSVSWQLPNPNRRRLALAAADAGVNAARSRLTAERAVLRQTMRETFARWATSTVKVETLRRWSDELDRLAARERDRAASGEASGLDARRMALAASEAQGRLARAEAERLEALAATRAFRTDLALGAVPELPPLVEASLTDAPPTPDPHGSESHPVVLALRADLATAMAERDLASRVLDLPSLSAGWQRQEVAGEVADGPTLGLSWAVPLFDRRQGARAGADARVVTTAARLDLAEREIHARREGALAAYAELRTAATGARNTAVEGSEVMSAATAAFQAGESSVTDLLDALRSATDAELSALDLHAETLAAHRRLEQLLGVSRAQTHDGDEGGRHAH